MIFSNLFLIMLVYCFAAKITAIYKGSSVNYYRYIHYPDEMHFFNNTNTTNMEYVYSPHDFILLTIPAILMIVFFLQ